MKSNFRCGIQRIPHASGGEKVSAGRDAAALKRPSIRQGCTLVCLKIQPLNLSVWLATPKNGGSVGHALQSAVAIHGRFGVWVA